MYPGRVLRWQYFPRSDRPPEVVKDAVEAFDRVYDRITSDEHSLNSDEVLGQCRAALESRGFRVETGKKKEQKISVPVLFGENGMIEKSFEADAHDERRRMVLEVEAGRGVVNNQFLKDLFQACLMHDVDYLGIAVRQVYQYGNSSSKDYERVVTFFDTLYASRRLTLPLRGLVVIGY